MLSGSFQEMNPIISSTNIKSNPTTSGHTLTLDLLVACGTNNSLLTSFSVPYVYANLVPHDDATTNGSARRLTAQEQKLYDGLGSDFTTADAKLLAQSLNIPWKTAERYIGRFVSHYGIARRIRNGQYRKI